MAPSRNLPIEIARKILGTPRFNKSKDLPTLCLQLSQALQRTPDDLARISTPRKLEHPPDSSVAATSPLWLDDVLARASSPIESPGAERRLRSKSEDSPPSSSPSTTTNVSKKPSLSASNATYGETLAPTMKMLLTELRMTHNGGELFPGHFIDVGSGRGIPSLCAAQSGYFQGMSKGIEYDEARYDSATILQKAYYTEEEAHLQRRSSTTKHTRSSTFIEFICGDIQDPTTSIGYLDDASVVFCNSVIWDASLCSSMGRLLDHSSLMSRGLVVSISRRFPSPDYRLVDLLSLPCNGGQDFTFYICQKDDGLGGEHNSPAISDTSAVLMLLKDNADLMENLVETLLKDEITLQELTLLASLGSSESVTRILLANDHFLPILTEQLMRADSTDLARVAVTTMVLRSMSDFPIGRRQIGGNAELLDALWDVVSAERQHPAIRTNVLDVLGQLDYDPIGHQSLTRKDVDSLYQTVLEQARSPQNLSQDLAEACLEAQTMRQWWQGEIRDLPY